MYFSNKTILGLIRLMGQSGVAIASIAVPLMVYRASGSLAYACVTIIMQWIPKLAFYLIGGQIVDRLSCLKAVRLVDFARMLVMIALCVCALAELPYMLIGILGAMFHCCNALSNIVFESTVRRIWDVDSEPVGHSTILRTDLLASIAVLPVFGHVSLPCCLLFGAALYLSITVLHSFRSSGIFSHVSRQAVRFSITREAQLLKMNSIKFFSDKTLFNVAAFSLVLGIPAALIGSAPSFFISEANRLFALDQTNISLLSTTTSGLSFLLLYGSKVLLEKNVCGPLPQFFFGLGTFVVGLIAIFFGQYDFSFFVCGFILFQLGRLLCLPLLRTMRQTRIHEDDRASMTGIAICFEGLSYIVGAGFGFLFAAHPLGFILPYLAFFLASTSVLYWKHTQTTQVLQKVPVSFKRV